MRALMTVTVLVFAAVVVATPLGTEFTYQGVLVDAGTPASGAFDFRFFLYDAEAGGSQVGPMVLVEDLVVSDGRVSTQLDFGGVFDGIALWLEVAVRDGGSTGSYTVLSPRQELTAAPFAQHAQIADLASVATTAGDADTLDSQHGSYYLDWSNFVGVPADLANGDDDALGDLSCNPDEIASWNGSAWSCSADDDTPFLRTYVVGPVGIPTQNGSALKSAVNAITPPSSQEEAVLVKLEPGLYDIGNTPLHVRSWMTIEGAGRESTIITGAVCDSIAGTINSWSDFSGLTRLTVRSTCSNPAMIGFAVTLSGNSATLIDCSFEAEQPSLVNTAIYSSGPGLQVRDVELSAVGAVEKNRGLVSIGDDADVSHAVIVADGGSVEAVAIDSTGDRISVRHSDLHAFGSPGTCTALAHSGGWFNLNDVELDATSCLGPSYGMQADQSSGKIFSVRASAYESAFDFGTSGENMWIDMHDVVADSLGDVIECSSGADTIYLDIRDSVLEGTGFAVKNLASTCSVRIWFSHLEPGTVGVSYCRAVVSGNNFFTNTCP